MVMTTVNDGRRLVVVVVAIMYRSRIVHSLVVRIEATNKDDRENKISA